jgi:hypothetical protein
MGLATGLVPWRYLHHRMRLHLIWAFPLLLAMLGAIVFFNLGVGHYRDALAINPDAQTIDVFAKLGSAPLALHTFQSVMLSTIGIGIALFAAYKGYTLFDIYPGYGKHLQRRERAKDVFEDRLRSIQKEINALATTTVDEARKTQQKTAKATHAAIRSIDDAISASHSYEADAAGIEEAAAAVVKIYRDANIQVRDAHRHPPPDYFMTRPSLQRRAEIADTATLQRMKDELVARDREQRAEFEMLAKRVPEEARALLSEAGFNTRLDRIKEAARKAREQEEARVSAEAAARSELGHANA